MRRVILIFLFLALLVVSLVLFFRVIDAALEIGDLKAGAYLRYREMQTLMMFMNASLHPCNLSVSKLDDVLQGGGVSSGLAWDGDFATLGSLLIVRKGECIVRISEFKGALSYADLR